MGLKLWHELGVALGLMLILEGILPFLQPARWRTLVAKLAGIDDTALRLMGLVTMLAGTALVYILMKV